MQAFVQRPPPSWATPGEGIRRPKLKTPPAHPAWGPAKGFSIPRATTREAPPRGATLLSLVDLRGFEPLTPCMPCRCATSCATGPRCPRGQPVQVTTYDG